MRCAACATRATRALAASCSRIPRRDGASARLGCALARCTGDASTTIAARACAILGGRARRASAYYARNRAMATASVRTTAASAILAGKARDAPRPSALAIARAMARASVVLASAMPAGPILTVRRRSTRSGVSRQTSQLRVPGRPRGHAQCCRVVPFHRCSSPWFVLLARGAYASPVLRPHTESANNLACARKGADSSDRGRTREIEISRRFTRKC